MRARWSGPLVISLIFCGVALILILNLDLGGTGSKVEPSAPSEITSTPPPSKPAGFREYPIGDDILKNAMRIAAVWLPPVSMQGGSEMPDASSDMVHLEADIHAAEGNPNGFPRDEFVPYLTITYVLTPLDKQSGGLVGEGEVLRGSLSPMVARDGWHYGASLLMPGPGRYRLDYHIEPPAAGRHADAATGVAPWWAPFDVSFDWNFEGVPRSGT